MKYPKNILMVNPIYYDVVYQINEHMNLEKKVDKQLAQNQWLALKKVYLKLGFNVIEAPGNKEFPDMVFAANQLFTTPEQIFLSQMKYPERKGEVQFLQHFLKLNEAIQVNPSFESMGDLLWDYEGERLFGGYGYRTDLAAYDEIKKVIDTEITTLELANARFYHLDTCLSIINKSTALFVPSAFSKETQQILHQHFTQLIEVDEQEALEFLACNAHCPDGENIIIEEGATKLQAHCQKIGLNVYTVDTSEFLKSGGSIFCLKNQGWF